jgi:TIR domain
MSYVPGFDYDFCVGYAHVDNDPVPGIERGWVSTLINILTSGSGLAGRLGGRDAFTWWMDERMLRSNDAVDQGSFNALTRSALFLAVLSPGYVMSEFCQLELATFIRQAGAGRLFVIDKEPLVEGRHPMPEALRNLRKYRFWEPDKNNRPRVLGWPAPLFTNSADRPYFLMVEDLSRDIAERLNELREQQKQEEVALKASDRREARADPVAPPPAEATAAGPRNRDEARGDPDRTGITAPPEESKSRGPTGRRQPGKCIHPARLRPRSSSAIGERIRNTKRA